MIYEWLPTSQSLSCPWNYHAILYAASRGSHLYVTCRSVCMIKVFDQQKGCLIVPFWGSWSLDFQWSKVKLRLRLLDCWFLAVWRSPWSLDQSPKRALIAWFSFDPGRKRFYTGHISDYQPCAHWSICDQDLWLATLITLWSLSKALDHLIYCGSRNKIKRFHHLVTIPYARNKPPSWCTTCTVVVSSICNIDYKTRR